LRSIHPGEQITINYSGRKKQKAPIGPVRHSKGNKCFCGEKKWCQGTVLPEEDVGSDSNSDSDEGENEDEKVPSSSAFVQGGNWFARLQDMRQKLGTEDDEEEEEGGSDVDDDSSSGRSLW